MAERSFAVVLSARVDAYVNAMRKAAAASNLPAESLRNLSRVGGTMQSVGGTMTRYVTLPLAAAGVAATKMAMDYDTAFAHMVGLAGAPADEIDRLKESVLDLAGATGQAPMELADALYQAMSSGLDTADAMDAVNIAAHGAAAGLGSSADIVSLAASAMTSYAESGLTAAEATDILTATIREGRADPDELAGSLGRILPVASRLGVSFDEVGGATAYLSNVFGDTNRTVTALSGVFNKLLAPTAQGRAALAEYGLSVEQVQAAISQDGLLGALELLNSSGLAGNSQALRAVFDDVEAFQGAQALLAADTATLTGIFDATKNSAGAMGDAFAVVAQTDGFKMKQALAQLQVALIEIGDILLPFAAKAGEAIADLAKWFSDLPEPIQQAAVALGALAAAGGPAIYMAGTLMKSWVTLSSSLSAMSSPAASAAKALGAIGIAAAVGYLGYQVFTEKQREAEQNTKNATAALKDEYPAMLNAAIAAGVASGEIDGVAIANEALANSISQSFPQLEDALSTLNVGASETLDVLTHYDEAPFDAIRALASGFLGSSEAADVFANALAGADEGLINLDIASLAAEAGVTEAQMQTLADAVFKFIGAIDDGEVNIQQIARDFLDAQVNASGYEGSMVAAAEAQLGFDRATGDAVEVYRVWSDLIANATPEQRAAAGVTEEMTAAMADLDPVVAAAASGVEQMTTEMVAAADAADTATTALEMFLATFTTGSPLNHLNYLEGLSRAFDMTTGSAMGLARAEDALWEAAQSSDEAWAKGTKTLDQQTEAGRQNRAVLFDWVDDILAVADAQIEQGDATWEVTNGINRNVEAMRDAAIAAGFNEDEVDALIETLGLMPEDITTKVSLAGQMYFVGQIEELLNELGEIPPEVLTEIETKILAGDAYGALNDLRAYAESPMTARLQVNIPRLPRITYQGSTPVYDYTNGMGGYLAMASGGFIPGGSNLAALLGDGGSGRAGDEVVLPLGNQARMASLLGMPDVGPRVVAAMGGGGGGNYTTVQYNTINMPPGSNGDDVVRALKQYERRSGPIPIRTR